VIVSTELEGGGGAGFGGFPAATVAVLATTRAMAITAATWTFRTRELIGLRIGRLPVVSHAPLTFATTAVTERFQPVAVARPSATPRRPDPRAAATVSV
jgi:hypothetical protein